MFREPTYNIEELLKASSQSILNVLQTFMDRFGQCLPGDAESLDLAQITKNLASFKVSGVVPEIDPQSVPEPVNSLRTQDADSGLQAMQLARALTVKLHHHLVRFL